jgi:hypothetical protein
VAKNCPENTRAGSFFLQNQVRLETDHSWDTIGLIKAQKKNGKISKK